MKLFYKKGACSLVPHIVINEIGLDCEYEAVDLKTKQTESGLNYLKINPKGAVPALLIKNDVILTENVVILQYLADKNKTFDLLPEMGDIKRYRVLEWLNYITTELHKNFAPLFNLTIPQEIKEKYLIPILKNKLDYVNAQLENKNYLYANKFTLPDAYLFVMILWAVNLKFDLNAWPHLSDYYAHLQERKSIQQALKEEALVIAT